MSSNDANLRTRAEPVAAPIADARFDPVGRLQVAGPATAQPRFTRHQLIVSFVLFNVVIWSAVIWWLLR